MKQALIGIKISDGSYYYFQVLVGLDYGLNLYGYIMLDTVYVGDYVGKIGNSLNQHLLIYAKDAEEEENRNNFKSHHMWKSSVSLLNISGSV